MSLAHGIWSHKNRSYTVAFADSQLFIERQDKPNFVGGIARGKVDRIVGKAAFVKLPPIGNTGATGYLEKAKNLKPGDETLVQVSGYATDSKAWPLSSELKLQGRRYIYLPHGRGIATSKKLSVKVAERLKAELHSLAMPGGWIIRSAASEEQNDFSDPQNVLEALELIDRAKAINSSSNNWLIAPPAVLERAALSATGPTVREYENDDLADTMDDLLRLDIPLHSEGRLRLGPTPALFTIDIDAGTQINMNQLADEAATAIMHVISSRAVAGQIVIDPVRAGASELLSYLKLFAQNSDLTLYGQTKMGLIELSRPRYGPSLYEALDD